MREIKGEHKVKSRIWLKHFSWLYIEIVDQTSQRHLMALKTSARHLRAHCTVSEFTLKTQVVSGMLFSESKRQNYIFWFYYVTKQYFKKKKQ